MFRSSRGRIRLLIAVLALGSITAGATGPVAASSQIASFSGNVTAGGASWAQHNVVLASGSTVEIVLDWDNASADLNLGLRNPAGTWVQWASSPTAKPERIVYEVTTSGTWVVGVSARSGAANYTVTVGDAPPPPTDVASYATMFGFGPNNAGNAGLYPYGMDWDATDDTILVGDLWNHRVLRFTAGGALIGEVAKLPGNDRVEPFDIEAGPDGSVWVGNEAQSRVTHFDHDGNWIKTIGLNGGPATHHRYPRGCGGGSMHWPTNIAIHPNTGRLFVSDGFCRDISVFDTDGRFAYSFGLDLRDVGINEPTPRGIDFDADGNLWLVEHKSRRVFKYSPNGERLLTGPRQENMLDPRGLVVDSERGRVYVVAAFYNHVFRFNATDGGFIGRWTGPGSGAGTDTFDSIRYPALDGDGNLYVGDTWGPHRVWKMSPTGTSLPWSYPSAPPPDGGLNQVSGIGIDMRTGTSTYGRLFAVDTFGNRGQAFDTINPANGELWRCRGANDCPSYRFAFGSRQPNIPNTAGFNYPRALTFGGGSVWVDGGQSMVRFAPDGSFVSRWGQWGSGPGQFRAGPTGIAVVGEGTAGRVYTTDLGNCRVMVSRFDGSHVASMGSCGTGANQMTGPWQLAVRGNRAYVADSGRNRVAIWDLDRAEIVQSVAGSFGGVALKNPRGLAIDPAGKWLYIADTGNVRIVRARLADPSIREIVTKGADTPDRFLRFPRYLEFGPEGRLFVSDFNQRIYAFNVPN